MWPGEDYHDRTGECWVHHIGSDIGETWLVLERLPMSPGEGTYWRCLVTGGQQNRIQAVREATLLRAQNHDMTRVG